MFALDISIQLCNITLYCIDALLLLMKQKNLTSISINYSHHLKNIIFFSIFSTYIDYQSDDIISKSYNDQI